jgi:hypothetical protein
MFKLVLISPGPTCQLHVAGLTWSTGPAGPSGQRHRWRGPPRHVSRRRLNAGGRQNAAAFSGARRKWATGRRFARGRSRSNGHSTARRARVVASPESCRSSDSERRSGAGVRDRSSFGQNYDEEERGYSRWIPRGVLSTPVGSGEAYGHKGHAGDEARRRGVRARGERQLAPERRRTEGSGGR